MYILTPVSMALPLERSAVCWLEVVVRRGQLVSYYEVEEGGWSEIEGKFWLQLWMGVVVTHTAIWSPVAGICGGCILHIAMELRSADEIMHIQTHLHIMLKIFPNIWNTLEKIHVFKVSVLQLTVFRSKNLTRKIYDGKDTSQQLYGWGCLLGWWSVQRGTRAVFMKTQVVLRGERVGQLQQ